MKQQWIVFLLLTASGPSWATSKALLVDQTSDAFTTRRLNCVVDRQKYPDPRLALVIGNGAYQKDSGWTSLGTVPTNDADDMADRLCQSGFQVTVVHNLKASEFRSILTGFANSLATAAKGLVTRVVYYSGHGAQIGENTYLIPTDVDVRAVASDGGAIRIEEVFRALDKDADGNPNITKIVILDACRADKGGDRPGLGRPRNAPTGTLVAYATAPDSVASPAGQNGRNSLYTEFLLKRMGEPGETIADLLRLVREQVFEASKHNQIPWETTSTIGNFMFEPPLRIDTVSLSLPDRDDLVIVSLNGVPVARGWRDNDPGVIVVPAERWRVGKNSLAVDVYNDKTNRNGHFWEPPEGWRYQVRLGITGTHAEQACWAGSEGDNPPRERWGALFRVLEAVVSVQPKTGAVSVTDVRHLGPNGRNC